MGGFYMQYLESKSSIDSKQGQSRFPGVNAHPRLYIIPVMVG